MRKCERGWRARTAGTQKKCFAQEIQDFCPKNSVFPAGGGFARDGAEARPGSAACGGGDGGGGGAGGEEREAAGAQGRLALLIPRELSTKADVKVNLLDLPKVLAKP